MSNVFENQLIRNSANVDTAIRIVESATEFLGEQYIESHYNQLTINQCEKLRELADKLVHLRVLTEGQYAVDHFATIENWESSSAVEEAPVWVPSESTWTSSDSLSNDWQYSNC